MLCSDGLTNELDDLQITAAITRSWTAQEAASRLVDLANHQGGRDNITAVVVGLNGRRAAAAGRTPVWVWPLVGGAVALAVVLALFPYGSRNRLAPTGQTATSALTLQSVSKTADSPESRELPPARSETEVTIGDQAAPARLEATQPPGQLLASPIETPVPTDTLVPPPTNTASPKPPAGTADPALRRPMLAAPADGFLFNPATDRIEFQWQWDGVLAEDEHFDVRVWSEGQKAEGVTWTKEQHYLLDLAQEPSRLTSDVRAGQYHWAIALVRGQIQAGRGQLEEELVQSAWRSFMIEAPDEPDEPDEPAGMQTTPDPPPPDTDGGTGDGGS